ncbi:MAG: hypothetical protein ACPH9F_06205 [Candidatus Poseidoniaceae archaeon]
MEDGQTPFANWVKTNASTANLLSIIMLIFAAWAAVEIVTNVVGNEIPPVTGMEASEKDNETQRINNGLVVGLGAVAGTLGLVLQLLIPREESEEVDGLVPDDDEEIDEVVDVMMEDIESEDEESEDEDLDDESEEENSTDEGDSLEEGDEVPEDEGDDSEEEEAPEEEDKTPVKKKKF